MQNIASKPPKMLSNDSETQCPKKNKNALKREKYKKMLKIEIIIKIRTLVMTFRESTFKKKNNNRCLSLKYRKKILLCLPVLFNLISIL